MVKTEKKVRKALRKAYLKRLRRENRKLRRRVEKKDSRRMKEQLLLSPFQRFCGKDAIVSSLKRILESLRHCPVGEVTDDLEMFSQEDMKRVACFENTPTNVEEFFKRIQVILEEVRLYFLPRLWTFQFNVHANPDGTELSRNFLKTAMLSFDKFCEIYSLPLPPHYVKAEDDAAVSFEDFMKANIDFFRPDLEKEFLLPYLRRMRFELTFELEWLIGTVASDIDLNGFCQRQEQKMASYYPSESAQPLSFL